MARRTYGNYVEGSSARKIEFQSAGRPRYERGSAAPARRQRESTAPKKENVKPARKGIFGVLDAFNQWETAQETSRARYRHMNSESMSLGSVLFMTAMVAVILFLGVTYLNYQAQITDTKNNINALKSNVEVLASQNDAVAYDIEAYIDINRIISVATGELGMVRVNQEQIKYFDKEADEFMNQYGDVPEE